MSTTIHSSPNNDPLLIQRTLSGDRQAFGELVEKYQSLVCAVAYSSLGDVSRSEDLAQETFLAAWRQLPTLKEPGRFKAWLCGIVRNLANNQLRKSGRAPESLDIAEADSQMATGPSPDEQASIGEESQLVWHALGRLPLAYREPLVLFYREHQSVAAVAASLEISEELVRQRLSRGRSLLRDEMAKVVEGALGRSRPGALFTIAVLAALPAVMPATAAAAVAATATKGAGEAAGGLLSFGVLTALAGPVMGIGGAWLGCKAAEKSAWSDRERREIRRQAWTGVLSSILFTLGLLFFGIFSRFISFGSGWLMPAGLIVVVVCYVAFLITTILRGNKKMARIRAEDLAAGLSHPPENWLARMQSGNSGSAEYRSKAQFLGLPLVHVNFGQGFPGEGWKTARGWIAIGNRAYGALLAVGGFAVGTVAVGGVGFGLVSFAGMAFGAFALGGVAAGWLAIGGCAIGWMAMGGLAIGWKAAYGGLMLEGARMLKGESMVVPVLKQGPAQISAVRRTILSYSLPWISTLLLVFPLAMLGLVSILSSGKPCENKRPK